MLYKIRKKTVIKQTNNPLFFISLSILFVDPLKNEKIDEKEALKLKLK